MVLKAHNKVVVVRAVIKHKAVDKDQLVDIKDKVEDKDQVVDIKDKVEDKDQVEDKDLVEIEMHLKLQNKKKLAKKPFKIRSKKRRQN